MPERDGEGSGEDRFGDLGAGSAPSGRSAAERWAERDERDIEKESEARKRPGPPRPSSRYGWVVGIVFVMAAGVALVNLIAGGNAGNALRGPEAGSRLPDFAAPLATGDVEGDANVRQGSSGDENLGKVPACEVETEGVLNSCEQRKRPLVLSFLFDRGADCEPQVDRVERMKARFPGVNFATVFFSRKDRDEVEEITRRRGWTQPVAIDRDGAVSNLLGVGGCPVTVFVLPGGRVVTTRLGNLTEDQLRAETRELLRLSRTARERRERR